MDVFVALCWIVLWTMRISGIFVFITYILSLIFIINQVTWEEIEDSAAVKIIIGWTPALILSILSWCIGW